MTLRVRFAPSPTGSLHVGNALTAVANRRLAAGVPAYDVARYMGTSVRMLDLTYGHLVKGSESAARERLDAFTNDAARAAKGGTR